MKTIVLKHLLVWVFLSIGYFFLTEPLVKFLFPGFYDVSIWLVAMIGGLVFIFLIMIIVLIINIVRHKQRQKASS